MYFCAYFVVLAYFKSSRNVEFMLRKNQKFWESLCILPEPKFGEKVVEIEPVVGAVGSQYASGGFGFIHDNDVIMAAGDCETALLYGYSLIIAKNFVTVYTAFDY